MMPSTDPHDLSIKPVYIAAPFGDPDPMRVAWNVQRATMLARLATLEGLAPLVVHPAIHAGCYGDDNDPVARVFGQQCSLALLRCVMFRSNGQLWLLHNDEGSDVLSSGCRAELALWAKYKGTKGVRRGGWPAWGQLATRHHMLRSHRMLQAPITQAELHEALHAAGVVR